MNTVRFTLGRAAAAAALLSALVLTSCWQDFNDVFIGASAAAPPEVTLGSSSITSSSITLNWAEPDAVAYSGTKITCTGNGSTTEIPLAKGTTTYTISGLTGVEYTVTVCATYSSGYESAGARFKITPTNKTLSFMYAPEQLSDVRNGGLGNYCILMADIDLSGYSSGTGWAPIGTATTGGEFSGVFNGNGHTISNLTINDSSTDYRGLFSITKGATIQNLSLTNVSVNGNQYVGGLAGLSTLGTISNCSVAGTVNGGGRYVGGLVGNKTGGTVENSYSSVTVSSTSISAGGLIGHCDTVPITNCHATGSVSGTSSVGGLVGYAGAGMPVSITNCFATGNVVINTYVAGNGAYAGGLVGNTSGVTITKCYALGNVAVQFALPSSALPVTAGGLGGRISSGSVNNCFARGNVEAHYTIIGGVNPVYAGGMVGQLSATAQYCYSTGSVAASTAGTGTVYIYAFAGGTSSTACYYDITTSGIADDGVDTNGIGKSHSDMILQSTYQPGTNDWNFSSIWSISSSINGGYPYLTGMAP